MFRTITTALVTIAVLAGCTSASVTPAPAASPNVVSGSPDPSAAASPGASAAATPTPAPSASPTPSVAPPVATGTLPVRGPGKELGFRVLLAAGVNGSVFSLIPRPGREPILARFDRAGRSGPGWPIALEDAEFCSLLLPADDGSVRVLCNVAHPVRVDRIRVFAFDADGRSLAGWPVEPGPGVFDAGRVVGGATLLFGISDQPGARVIAIAQDGSIRRGAAVRFDDNWGTAGGTIGPDGLGYSVLHGAEQSEGSPEVSRITGWDLSGVRAGWPVKVDGIASGAAFAPDARVVFAIGSRELTTSRVAVFDRNGNVILRSARFPIKTAESGVDCVAYAPRAPLTAPDGTVFLWSEIDDRIFALDASLEVLPGWPYRPASWLVRPGWDDPTAELNCSPPAPPSVGPTGTLYLPLQPRNESVGGTLVALDRDGRPHAGWPVTLQRPGAEFLWTVVGSDGTVYALAKEPEAGNSASVTILAIAPDSTVLYRTTIIEP